MKIITGSIDVTKIDKSKIITGEKGKYLNVTIRLNDEKDQYKNDGMITQSVNREERIQGERGTILGNVRIVFDGNQTQKQQSNQINDDIPF